MNEMLQKEMDKLTEELLAFEKIMIQTPSVTGGEKKVAHLVKEEMERLGFLDVHFDSFGSVMGHVGTGAQKILFDAHIDTVDAKDAEDWQHGPYSADIVDGEIWGRGSVDTKSSVVAMIYGAHLMDKLGYLEGKSVYVSASVMEEDYDGELLDRAMVENDLLDASFAVIGEPTNLKIARGHRGRAMYVVTTEGVSAHGSMPHLGVNAIYGMQELIGRVEALNEKLQAGEGDPGSVALTKIESRAASLNAVPDACRIYLDRRLAFGETEDIVAKEMDELVEGTGATWEIYDAVGPSWTGKEVVLHTFLPAWEEPVESSLTQTGMRAYQNLFEEEPELFMWNFATNGFACAERYHVPTIGLGPGDISYAHQKDEHCPVEDIYKAAMFYAELVKEL